MISSRQILEKSLILKILTEEFDLQRNIKGKWCLNGVNEIYFIFDQHYHFHILIRKEDNTLCHYFSSHKVFLHKLGNSIQFANTAHQDRTKYLLIMIMISYGYLINSSFPSFFVHKNYISTVNLDLIT